jgi:hypothetical protein
VQLDRLRQLEAFETRVGLDAENVALQLQQIKHLEDALALERARNEQHAEAFMLVARSCDSRAREMETQHAAAISSRDTAVAKLEDHNAALKDKVAALKASHAAAITKAENQNERLKVENAALKASLELALSLNATAAQQGDVLAKLTEIHIAVTALRTLEIHPVRPDRRQFAEWLKDPMPQSPPRLVVHPMQFDRAWCAAVCRGGYKVDIDSATGTRAHFLQNGSGNLTLRSTTPLPRPVLGQQHQLLPAFRVIVDAYGLNQWSQLGFVPSPSAGRAATPTKDYTIYNYGGCHLTVRPLRNGNVYGDSGWIVLPPRGPAAAAAAAVAEEDAEAVGTSDYATTATVPPVPPGSAVEFAVDYAAGTCRVAFYSPAALARGPMEEPEARMELRFVATESTQFGPARSVPTAADSGVDLHPAVQSDRAGAKWRFVTA